MVLAGAEPHISMPCLWALKPLVLQGTGSENHWWSSSSCLHFLGPPHIFSTSNSRTSSCHSSQNDFSNTKFLTPSQEWLRMCFRGRKCFLSSLNPRWRRHQVCICYENDEWMKSEDRNPGECEQQTVALAPYSASALTCGLLGRLPQTEALWQLLNLGQSQLMEFVDGECMNF